MRTAWKMLQTECVVLLDSLKTFDSVEQSWLPEAAVNCDILKVFRA